VSKRPAMTTRFIVLLATEPSLRLSADEIARKFGMPRRHVCTTLRYSVRNGWIKKYTNKPYLEYGAGPVLLAELGEL
jgi:predicted transcriptional regulator